MHIMSRFMAWFNLVLLNLIAVTPSLAEDQPVPQTPPWPGWHSMQWHGSWWIFPLLFFGMMIVMCFFMMRRGGSSCMGHDRKMHDPGTRDEMQRHGGDSLESAQTILDKRYASGEIDKQEYEEKKAALHSS